MAAALQPGFKPSFEHSSGRTVTQSSTGSAEGNYNLQNYPAARHSVESFGGVQAADGSAQGATATARSGGATAPTATPHVSAAAPAAAVGLAGAAGTEIKPAPARLVSPSKAAAASALSGYSAVQAGAPAVATTEPAAGQGRTGQHYKGSTALLDLQQLQGRAAVRTAAAAGAAGVPGSVSGVGTQGAPRGVYVGPIEHALMPGQQHTGFASARSSSSSADDRGVSLLAASPAAASKPPAAAVASSAAVDLTAVTELSEVLPAEGGVEGVESSAAAAAASGQSGPAGTAAAAAPAVRDDRVEYEVEVLGIIPGESRRQEGHRSCKVLGVMLCRLQLPKLGTALLCNHAAPAGRIGFGHLLIKSLMLRQLLPRLPLVPLDCAAAAVGVLLLLLLCLCRPRAPVRPAGAVRGCTAGAAHARRCQGSSNSSSQH
jgi:hypothetical protein